MHLSARKSRLRIAFIAIAAGAVLSASLLFGPVRSLASAAARLAIPKLWLVHLNGLRFGYGVDYGVRIPMADGVRLAASVYRPRGEEKLATVLVRLPYNRLEYSEALNAAEFFARNGYAVVLEDIRGKYASEGEFVPYRSGTADGAATLDWIVGQPWSNGRVGTFGCSALGELQYVLARARHPALAAMIPLGAGGAVGAAAGRHAYFGLYEGGVFQLASGYGWFRENGAKDPHAPSAPAVDIATALRGLPVAGLVANSSTVPNSFADFASRTLTDPWWQTLDYVGDADIAALTVPALVVNTWGDQTVGDTLALSEAIRAAAPGAAAHQHVIIAPGTHCHSEETGRAGQFGDIEVRNAQQPYQEWFLRWFDFWLRERGTGLADLPPYLYYMMGEQRWLTATQWPPREAQPTRWYLGSGGHANSREGDGVLAQAQSAGAGADEFRYDPLDPVPTRGGPLCCTGNPADRAGPVDQHDVEIRKDVLVYTSAPLQAPLRIAGPLRARLTVTSSARDTDFVARLVHVWPDGKATNIQEGALRARYREGIAHPRLLVPGTAVELSIDMRSIAYTVPAGHRLRLHVTSSSFPRLERNLNTGGSNFDETQGVTAVNRVLHGPDAQSWVELPLLPADG